MKAIVFFILKIMMFLVSLLPFWVLYFISDILFILIYNVFKYRRRVVRVNLNNSFPEKSDEEITEIEKKFYHHLIDLIFESVKMMTISEKEIQKRFRVKNPEEITKYTFKGQSVIAVSGHYGNWEWGNLAVPKLFKSNFIVVYKPLSDKKFEKLLNKMRSRFGSILVPMKQTLKKIVEYKSQPSVFVLIGDQTPPREESNYFTSFLNQETAVLLGVEKISVKTNYPVIYFNINKRKRGYYECVIKPLVDKPQNTEKYEVTNRHTQILEDIIIRKPEYWLWSHKRWKFSPRNITVKHD